MQRFCSPFKALTGKELVSAEQILNSGSNRNYFRLRCDTVSMIGVIGDSPEENRAFLGLTRHFLKRGLPVPELYYVSDDEIWYMQEDLGETSLFDFLKRGRERGNFAVCEVEMLEKSVRRLISFQFEGAAGLDFSICFPRMEFDRRSVMWDLNYFKYCFLKPAGTPFREDLLEDDFEAMADILLQWSSNTFLYRDFQSRNVIIRDNTPYFIDYQGGRRGPLFYDLASFLWQARAAYPEELREHLIGVYREELQHYMEIPEQEFRDRLAHFVLFRTLQVLGAYGFRGYLEQKRHFIESIPFALENIRGLLRRGYPEYPYLCELLKRLTT